MQLENQFDKVADEIELAKTKRRYVLNCALMRKRGEPLPNPLDLMGSPIDARSRSLGPAIAYPTKAEVEASIRDATYRIAKRGVSKKTREKFERIVEKRKEQLRRGLYRESIAEIDACTHGKKP